MADRMIVMNEARLSAIERHLKYMKHRKLYSPHNS